MNKNLSETLSFEDRIDTLFRELELAVKWQQPSILFATFDSEDIHGAAEVALENKLIEIGQTIPRIQLENSEIAFWLSESDNLEKTVFFVEGVNKGNTENGFNAYSALDILQDFFVENRIRIVFWLTGEQAVDLAHFAPDFWSFRHRVIEFNGLSIPQQALQQETDPVKLREHDGPSRHNPKDANSIFRDLLLYDLPEGDESTAIFLNLLLTLGILHWRQGNYEKAAKFLDSALNNGRTLKDKYFEAECLSAVALVNTSLGKVDEAIEAYQQAIRLAPDQTIPWNNLGNLYIKKNRCDEAIAAFRKAIEQSPEDAVSWNGLGNAHRRKGHVDDAISAFQKAVELAPTYGYPWNSLGDVFTTMGQIEEAIAAYQKAIETNNHIASPWINLGRIFMLQNRNEDAIKAFQNAVEIEPNNIHALDGLDNLYRKLGADENDPIEIPQDINQLKHTIQSGQEYTSPENLTASQPIETAETASALLENNLSGKDNDHQEKSSFEWNELGHEHLKVGAYDEAINAYIKAIEQSKDLNWSYINNLALAHYHKGKHKTSSSENGLVSGNAEGIEITDEKLEETTSPALPKNDLIEKDSTQPPADTIYEEPEGSASDWQEAFSTFEIEPTSELYQSKTQSEEQIVKPDILNKDRSIRSIQSDVEIKTNAIQEDAQFGLDQLEGASTSSQEILDYDVDRALKGFSYPEKNTEMVGEEIEEKPSGKDPKTAFEWNELGNIYLKSGAHEKAISAYIKAIEISPKFGWSYSNLAFVYCHKGKYSDAIPLYKKSIELFKSDKEKAISWNRLGDAYRRLKDRKRAREAYQMAAKLDSDNDSLITRARLSLLSNSSS